MKVQGREAFLHMLQIRFEKHAHRHEHISWQDVSTRLDASSTALASLHAIENSGGEPDVVDLEPGTDQCIFCDCSAESPLGRRSVCYDDEALKARKENKPAGSAVDMAAAIGIELLTEEHYRRLQQFGEFDTKTSSWIATPQAIRTLGGALFGDRRFGRVFVYHNGAQSYYAARGFRGLLRV